MKEWLIRLDRFWEYVLDLGDRECISTGRLKTHTGIEMIYDLVRQRLGLQLRYYFSTFFINWKNRLHVWIIQSEWAYRILTAFSFLPAVIFLHNRAFLNILRSSHANYAFQVFHDGAQKQNTLKFPMDCPTVGLKPAWVAKAHNQRFSWSTCELDPTQICGM